VPRAELPITFWTILLLAVAVISLRRGGLRVTSRRIAFLCPGRRETGTREIDQYVRRAVHSVDVAAVWIPWYANCLARSLVVQVLLRHRGIDGELRIGVRTEGSALAAHAWAEVDGLPVNDDPAIADAFKPLETPMNAAILRAMR
jgi:hypothetical protein